MSAPVRQPRVNDPALMYAPPHVREHGRKSDDDPDERRSGPPLDWPPDDADSAPEFGSDRAILNVQRRLALNPEWIPEPPIVDHRNLRTAILWMAGLLAFGAIVAWVIMSTPAVKLLLRGAVISASFSGNGASASVPPESRSLPGVSKAQRLDRPVNESAETGRQPRFAHPPSAESRHDAMAGGALPIATVTAASVAPTAASAASEAHSPAEATNFVSRRIERSELDAMLARADGFIKSGDLSSARLLLRRAAEAGDVRAAFTLAGTFDPNVLKALGVPDGAPDLPQARLWYERAAQLGSPDAQRRLQQLATALAQ